MNHSLNRFYLIQGSVQSLVHSSHCRDANCRMPGCLNVKKIVAHAKHCEKKNNRGCTVCKQYIALCYHHTKACKETKCPVLFCLNIRHKLLQQRKHQAQIIKRKFTTMQNSSMPSAVTRSNAENSYAASQLSPVVQAPAPTYLTQPGMDENLAAGGPSQIVPTQQQHSLQTLIQTLKYQPSQQRQQKVLSMLKSNPQLMKDFVKHRTEQKMQQQQRMQVQMQQNPLPQQVVGVPNRMMGMGGVNRWENANYPQNSQPAALPGSIGNPAARGPSQMVPKQGSSLPNQQQHSLQTLIQTLKYQPSQQQKVLSILKSNPQLMNDFVKQRTEQKMQQQQQMQVQMQQNRLPQQVLGVPNRMMGMGGVNRWENANYPQNSQPHPNLQPCLAQLEILLREVHLE